MVLAQNDGLTQDELTKIVKVDKAATARRIRSLEKTIMPRGWHHDKWNHCKMIGIEYLPTTTYTVINGKDRFFFGPLARRKN